MIKVYTLPTCPPCHQLIEWLDQHNIEYTEINAKGNSSITTTPTIDIDGKRIIGFDEEALKQALFIR